MTSKEENPEQIFSKNDLDYQNLKQEFEQYKKESIKWGVEDFLHLDVEGYYITPENAQKALERMIDDIKSISGIEPWYREFCTPNDKYYVLKGTQNFFKKEKNRTIFVGEGDNVNLISVQTDDNIPIYYEECTRDEFIAAYQKVKELLIGVQI